MAAKNGQVGVFTKLLQYGAMEEIHVGKETINVREVALLFKKTAIVKQLEKHKMVIETQKISKRTCKCFQQLNLPLPEASSSVLEGLRLQEPQLLPQAEAETEGQVGLAAEVKKLEELEPAVGGQEPQIISEPPALDITSVVTAQGEVSASHG